MTASLGTPAGVERSLPGRRTWLRRGLVGACSVLLAYLTLTFANPGVVPRASFLPRPASRGIWFDACNGRPGNRHVETWEQGGLFWIRSEFSTLAGCIDS